MPNSKKEEKKYFSDGGLKFILSSYDKGVIDLFTGMGFTRTFSVEEADFAVFPGGADISPVLYGERALEKTFFNVIRDIEEISFWNSLPRLMPKIGICRGAQLGAVLCGARLFQHVNNHTSEHEVEDTTGFVINNKWTTTSTHHQQIRLTPNCYDECWVLGVSEISTEKSSEKDFLERDEQETNSNEDLLDIEVCYFASQNFLAFQGHPEYDLKDAKDLQCKEAFFAYCDCLYSKDKYFERKK